MLENSYGIVKRLDFVSGVISQLRPHRVLDMGCGTGSNLTAPLARNFPAIEFVGVDSDPASIQFARQADPTPNASYFVEPPAGDRGTFDLVIASEVIEHVENPDEFLRSLLRRLTTDGQVILTLPNGAGPFELVSLVETMLHLTGVYACLRWCKHRLRGSAPPPPAVDSLAISPHINFFSYREILSTIAFGGFEVVEARSRTLFAGLGFDHLMTSPRQLAWNASVADRVPMQFVSGWMFLLRPSRVRERGRPYRRGVYARLRRYLNEKRWNLR